MKTRQSVEGESAVEVEPPLGIEAKTGPYPAERSWSGRQRRVLGREAFFDDLEKEALRHLA